MFAKRQGSALKLMRKLSNYCPCARLSCHWFWLTLIMFMRHSDGLGITAKHDYPKITIYSRNNPIVNYLWEPIINKPQNCIIISRYIVPDNGSQNFNTICILDELSSFLLWLSICILPFSLYRYSIQRNTRYNGGIFTQMARPVSLWNDYFIISEVGVTVTETIWPVSPQHKMHCRKCFLILRVFCISN